MTRDARQFIAVLTFAVFVAAGFLVAYLYLDHRPLRRHLIPLPTPAPADHGWTTPSQPTSTTGATP